MSDSTDDRTAVRGPLSTEREAALNAASADYHDAQVALHKAVCAFVDELRAQGRTLEQSVEHVLAFVRPLRQPLSALDADERMIRRMTEWCNAHWLLGV